MRFKNMMLLCGLLLIGYSAILVYERNRYNIISNVELKIVHEKLAILSSQEKKDLSAFIDEAILFGQYPYTLVGYKPMSLFNFPKETEVLEPDYGELCERNWKQTIGRGYLVWKKYQSLFPSRKTILVEFLPAKSSNRREMVLICSNLCKTTILENLDDFCEILGRSCNSEEIFEILTHADHSNFREVMEHDRLLGILLGFGKNNAYLFERHRGLFHSLDSTRQLSKEKDPLQSFTNEWPVWPRKWRLPGFACDLSTDETKQLKDHYKEARKIIRWTYFNRDNLEVTLALLTQP